MSDEQSRKAAESIGRSIARIEKAFTGKNAHELDPARLADGASDLFVPGSAVAEPPAHVGPALANDRVRGTLSDRLGPLC